MNSGHEWLIHPVLDDMVLGTSLICIQSAWISSLSFISMKLLMRSGCMCRMPKIILSCTMCRINIFVQSLNHLFFKRKDRIKLLNLKFCMNSVFYLWWRSLVFTGLIMFFFTTAEVASVTCFHLHAQNWSCCVEFFTRFLCIPSGHSIKIR